MVHREVCVTDEGHQVSTDSSAYSRQLCQPDIDTTRADVSSRAGGVSFSLIGPGRRPSSLRSKPSSLPQHHLLANESAIGQSIETPKKHAISRGIIANNLERAANDDTDGLLEDLLDDEEDWSFLPEPKSRSLGSARHRFSRKTSESQRHHAFENGGTQVEKPQHAADDSVTTPIRFDRQVDLLRGVLNFFTILSSAGSQQRRLGARDLKAGPEEKVPVPHHSRFPQSKASLVMVAVSVLILAYSGTQLNAMVNEHAPSDGGMRRLEREGSSSVRGGKAAKRKKQQQPRDLKQMYDRLTLDGELVAATSDVASKDDDETNPNLEAETLSASEGESDSERGTANDVESNSASGSIDDEAEEVESDEHQNDKRKHQEVLQEFYKKIILENPSGAESASSPSSTKKTTVASNIETVVNNKDNVDARGKHTKKLADFYSDIVASEQSTGRMHNVGEKSKVQPDQIEESSGSGTTPSASVKNDVAAKSNINTEIAVDNKNDNVNAREKHTKKLADFYNEIVASEQTTGHVHDVEEEKSKVQPTQNENSSSSGTTPPAIAKKEAAAENKETAASNEKQSRQHKKLAQFYNEIVASEGNPVDALASLNTGISTKENKDFSKATEGKQKKVKDLYEKITLGYDATGGDNTEDPLTDTEVGAVENSVKTHHVDGEVEPTSSAKVKLLPKDKSGVSSTQVVMKELYEKMTTDVDIQIASDDDEEHQMPSNDKGAKMPPAAKELPKVSAKVSTAATTKKTKIKVEKTAVKTKPKKDTGTQPMRKDDNGKKLAQNLPPSFANLVDVASGKKGNPIFWNIPKAGGSFVKDFTGSCMGMAITSEVSARHGHSDDKVLAVFEDEGNKYVNVDTTSLGGIYKAKELNLASSGLADVIFTPYVHEASTLFDSKHKGSMFAILRDPVDRAVSMYEHLCKSDKSIAKMTLEEYATSARVENNWMTRFLVGKMWGPLSNDHLEQAKEILRTKILVGIFEKKEETLERFQQYFGWDRSHGGSVQTCLEGLIQDDSKASGSTHEKVDKGSQPYALLFLQNKFDMRLYRYGLEIFNEGL